LKYYFIAGVIWLILFLIMKKTAAAILLLLIIPLFFVACDKGKEETSIPYVYVNFTIYPNTLDFIPDGGWVYVTGGYKGIIIYRHLHDEFLAFERACPFDPLEDDARVEVESSGIIATDPNCGSRFLLTDGSPIQGPATVGLKQYRTMYDGFTLIVTN
jgi:nitrite reductase/ring-hydroxylating ferredoxin subunit